MAPAFISSCTTSCTAPALSVPSVGDAICFLGTEWCWAFFIPYCSPCLELFKTGTVSCALCSSVVCDCFTNIHQIHTSCVPKGRRMIHSVGNQDWKLQRWVFTLDALFHLLKCDFHSVLWLQGTAVPINSMYWDHSQPLGQTGMNWLLSIFSLLNWIAACKWLVRNTPWTNELPADCKG